MKFKKSYSCVHRESKPGLCDASIRVMHVGLMHGELATGIPKFNTG